MIRRGATGAQNGIQGGAGALSSPVLTPGGGETTPWGERKRHQQVDDDSRNEWVAVQKKTFTRWCNSYLRERGLQIEDLFSSTSDGILLLNLLEIISQDSVLSACGRKYNKQPKMRIHNLENCNLIFEFCKKKNLQLTNIGSTDIVDANPKLILGLLWTIILRFAIAEDGKQGLLLWCKRSTEGYDGVDVDNFDFSWRDGRAFLALINKYRPEVFSKAEFDALDKNDAHGNVALAFNIAKEKLGIDQLLDVEDLVDSARPDEKSVIAYLSMFFQKFAPLTRSAALVDSIIQAISVTRKHDGLIQRYKSRARALRSWVQENVNRLSGPDDSSSTVEIKEKLDALQEFRKNEKPTNKAVLLELNSILGQLRTSQRSNGRPPFQPEEELTEKSLWDKDWPTLESAEMAYEEALLNKFQRFQVIDFSVSKVENKLSKLEPWLESRVSYFDTDDYGNSVASAEQKLSNYDAFAAQSLAYKAMAEDGERVANELDEAHGAVKPLKERLAKAAADFKTIEDKAEEYKKNVLARLALEKDLVADALKYTQLANELTFKLEEVDEAIKEPLLGHSVEDVTDAKERFAEMGQKFLELEPKMSELQALGTKLAENEREDSVEIPLASVLALFSKMKVGLKEREKTLEEAMVDTKKRVDIRKRFAELAEDLNTYIKDTTEASNFQGNKRASMKPEAVTKALQQLKEDYKGAGQQKLQAVESASQAQEDAHIVANGMTTQTIYSLRTAFEELGKLLDSRLESHLAALAALQTENQLSEDQLKEVKKVFDALDKDRDGLLSSKEFKDGLQGLGVVVDDSEADAKFASLCKTSPGHMVLAEFASYMLDQLKTGSSREDILGAYRVVAGGPYITTERITTVFVCDDFAQYMIQHMPKGADENSHNYEAFTNNIFER